MGTNYSIVKHADNDYIVQNHLHLEVNPYLLLQLFDIFKNHVVIIIICEKIFIERDKQFLTCRIGKYGQFNFTTEITGEINLARIVHLLKVLNELYK